jgi:hypothetical protein
MESTEAVRRTIREQDVSSRERSIPDTPLQRLGQDLAKYLSDYARTHPEYAALWCLGIGFILGWKLKPW